MVGPSTTRLLLASYPTWLHSYVWLPFRIPSLRQCLDWYFPNRHSLFPRPGFHHDLRTGLREQGTFYPHYLLALLDQFLLLRLFFWVHWTLGRHFTTVLCLYRNSNPSGTSCLFLASLTGRPHSLRTPLSDYTVQISLAAWTALYFLTSRDSPQSLSLRISSSSFLDGLDRTGRN